MDSPHATSATFGAPAQPLLWDDGRMRGVAYEDYLDLNFFYWSQECLESLLDVVTVGS